MIKVGLNLGNSKISCAVVEIKDNYKNKSFPGPLWF